MPLTRGLELALIAGALALGTAAYALVGLGLSGEVPPNTAGVALLFAALFGAAHVFTRLWAPKAHGLLLGLAAFLNVIGYAVVSRLDSRLAANQAEWMVIGVAVYIVSLFLLRDYRLLDRFRYTIVLVGIIFLLAPLLPGIGREINRSRLWLRFGSLSFQPGEVAKVLLTVFFASYLAERGELMRTATRKIAGVWLPSFRHFGPIVLAWGFSLAVLFFERDLGQSLLLFALFVGMLWMGTGRSAFLVLGVILFAIGAFAGYQVFDHVEVRVATWRDPFADPFGDGFQLIQSLFALAAGGIGGVGLGRGGPDAIPFAATDFIFSAIAEELGLLGACAVLVGYLLLVGAALRVALLCRDPFAKLLAAGLGLALAVQVFVVVGGVTKLVPLTGVTLPFMSYGGSSLLSSYIVVAMLVSLSHQEARAGPGLASTPEPRELKRARVKAQP